MKNTKRLFIYLLVPALLTSCVSRPEPLIEEIKTIVEPTPIIEYIEEIIKPEVIPVPLTPVEKLIERIKQNGADIEKYHLVNANEEIIVKADLQDEAGDYEVIYYLDEAHTLDDSVYLVRFTAREKETDEIIEDTLIWKPAEGNAGILLSFDDYYVKSWIEHMHLFDTYGAKVTFFMQGGFDPFCHTALEHGHDVGFHTINHLDLRSLSAAAFARETNAQALRQQGIPADAFAYPYGFYYAWMNDALLQNFSVLRGYGVTFRIYDKNDIYSSYISSRSIDNTVIQSDSEFKLIIISMLRALKFLDGNWVLPLTTHDISGAAWGIKPERLVFVLSQAAELRLKFYRFCDFSEAQTLP